MYRVRPNRRGDVEEVKRYNPNLKIRLEARFLRGPGYRFEDRLRPEHVERGVWICLNHFGGVTEDEFYANPVLPEDAFLIKDRSKKNVVQVRVSALPVLEPSRVYLKHEPPVREREQKEEKVREEEETGAGSDEVSITYASPAVDRHYSLNRRIFGGGYWTSRSRVDGVSGGALQFFWRQELCLPSFVDGYIRVAARVSGNAVLCLSSDVFEAALRRDSSASLDEYFAAIDYSSEMKFVLLPYYFHGRWSLVVYDLENTKLVNYVLTEAYDSRVRQKIEQIAFSLQDSLRLRRVGLLAKNTYTNYSKAHDSQYLSGVKVLWLMRCLLTGQNIQAWFEDPYEEEVDLKERRHMLLYDVCFGDAVEQHRGYFTREGRVARLNRYNFGEAMYKNFCEEQ